MRYRYLLWGDKLLLLALLALLNGYSTYIRVALRGVFEGGDFKWAYYSGITAEGKAAVVKGAGLLGHTDHILIGALVVVWLLCAGCRKPDRFFQAALLGWTSIGFGVGLWLQLRLGAGLTSSKETLGLIALPYGLTELLPDAIAWLLAAALFGRGLLQPRSMPPSSWTALNTYAAATALGLLTVSAVLLNLGPQHGWADFNGIGMIYMALMLFFVGVSPWERRTATAALRPTTV